MATTREEHLQWCKDRALKYIEQGNAADAYGSMVSDLGKHPETADHPAIQFGMALLFTGNLNSCEEVRKFIEGFN